MPLKVHAVVQNARNLNLPITYDTKEDNVASSSVNSGNMQRANALPKFWMKPHSVHRRAFRETREGPSKRFGVDARLLGAKPSFGPEHYVSKV